MDRRQTLAALLATTLAPATSWAQDFPFKPIKLIVAFGAGSGNDLIARVVGLFPETFVGVCMLPQSPKADMTASIAELERCVTELGFIGCNLNPDPGGGHFTHRFLMLQPKRLWAAAIGAPGSVTLLDPTRGESRWRRSIKSYSGMATSELSNTTPKKATMNQGSASRFHNGLPSA